MTLALAASPLSMAPWGVPLTDPVVLAAAPEPLAAEKAGTVSLGLAPVVTAIDLPAGTSLAAAVTCTNEGNVPLHVVVERKDVVRRPGGGLDFEVPGRVFWSVGSWLAVEPEETDLLPDASCRLAVTVAVPPGTPDGEYYGALNVTARPTVDPAGTGLVAVRAGLSSLFCVAVGENQLRAAALVPYGTVPGLVRVGDSPLARLAGFLVHGWRRLVIGTRNVAWLAEGSPLRLFLPLANLGPTHIQPRVTATIYEGDTVRRILVYEGEVILPAEAKVLELVWADSPLYGRFHLALRVDYGGPEPLEVQRSFVLLPVKGTLGLVAMAFGLGYLIARRGQRRARGTGPSAPPPAVPS